MNLFAFRSAPAMQRTPVSVIDCSYIYKFVQVRFMSCLLVINSQFCMSGSREPPAANSLQVSDDMY